MIRISELLNYGAYVDNKYLGIVKDFTIYKNKIYSFLIEGKGIVSFFYLIPLNSSAQSDGIISSKKAYRVKKGKINKYKNNMLFSFLGREVFDDKNNLLGTLSDVIFNEEMGRLEAFIVSGGFVEDLIGGRKVLLTDGFTHKNRKIFVKGPDVVLYNDSNFKKFIKE